MHKRTNNSIVALVIGSGLARREMSRTAAPFVKAGQSLAGVAQAERLNVTATDAERIFQTAAADLAFLAIPQVVALHIELCVGTIEEVRKFPGLVKEHPRGWHPRSWNVPDLGKVVRFGDPETAADHLMKFCVKLRNIIMHGAGKVDDQLVNQWKILPPVAKKRWETLAGRAFGYKAVGTLPELAWGEVLATLAVTKESAHEINARVTRLLTREQWSQIIACDYRDSSRHGRRRFNNPLPVKEANADGSENRLREDRTLRRLQAHAATYYGLLAMTPDELSEGRVTVLK
jgi:hypothetical protein